jgi:hypothetical protein
MNIYRYSPENWQQTGCKTLLCSCIHSSLRQHAVFMAICHEYNYYHKQKKPLEKRNHNIRVLWKVKLQYVSSMRRTPHKIVCLGQQMSFVSYWPWYDPAEQNQNVWWAPQPRIVQIPTRRGDLLSTRRGDLKPCTALDLIWYKEDASKCSTSRRDSYESIRLIVRNSQRETDSALSTMRNTTSQAVKIIKQTIAKIRH